MNRKRVPHPLKLGEKKGRMGVDGEETVVGGSRKLERSIPMSSNFSVRWEAKFSAKREASRVK